MELGEAERSRRNELIRKLVWELDQRCPGEAAHSAHVAVYAVATAAEMGGDDGELLAIRYAAELHAIGKRDCLARDVNEPARAAEEIAAQPFLLSSVPLVLHHYERWNGSGYPNGLAGHRIPLGARIIAVADTFDTMTMPWAAMTRPPDLRGPIPEDLALESIWNEAGRKFDPAVVRAFLKVQPVIQPIGL